MDDFARSLALGCVLVCALGIVGCADAERIEPIPPAAATHTAGFVGHVYDGATGERLTDYSIEALAATTTIDGSVDADGRYSVGNVSVWEDFTIIIEADGYRPFVAHNAHVGLPAELSQSDDIADISTHQTLHFDAYVFPSALEAPEVTFTITTPLGAEPAGTIRMRPTSSSLLADDDVETPSGVPGQIWTNDEDLLAATVVQDFSGGTATFGTGELVYGVTYQIDVFGVVGFQPLTATYTAGVEGDKTLALAEEVTEPLMVITSSHEGCSPPSGPAATSGAVVVIEFNQDVEAHTSGYPGGPQEALDDGISITSPDADEDTVTNDLASDVSENAQERGVTIGFAGKAVTISWNPSVGLASSDPDDPITEVTYAGLANVMVRRVGSPSSATSLATLLGVSSITCQ